MGLGKVVVDLSPLNARTVDLVIPECDCLVFAEVCVEKVAV